MRGWMGEVGSSRLISVDITVEGRYINVAPGDKPIVKTRCEVGVAASASASAVVGWNLCTTKHSCISRA